MVLGERSWLYSSYAFLHYQSTRPLGVQIGHDSGVYDGTFFECGASGEVVIGDFCAIVGAIIRTDRRVTIGAYSFIAHEVLIADEARLVPPARALAAGAPGLAPAPADGIRLGHTVWVGARAVLCGAIRIGDGAIVGAGSVVTSDVPDHSIVAGNPARVVGQAR